MKYREGFVSNSSSASFCFKGICVDEGKFLFPDDEDDCDIGQMIEDIVKEHGLIDITYCYPPDYACVFIGVDYEAIGDDETGRQFTERVQATCDKFCDVLKIEHQIVSCQEGEYYC